ncbi:MAG: hypothetical protein KKB31_00810 [Nanoarchaeota archaeon]|nr:hypothetical protein [Nanoarchaeota archaeon]
MNWKFLAKMKILLGLFIAYLTLWSQAIILFLYLKINVDTVFIVLGYVVCLVMTLIDWRWIYPHSEEWRWIRNPAYKKIIEEGINNENSSG